MRKRGSLVRAEWPSAPPPLPPTHLPPPSSPMSGVPSSGGAAAEVQALTLKVMRLCKPSFRVSPVTLAARGAAEPLAAEAGAAVASDAALDEAGDAFATTAMVMEPARRGAGAARRGRGARGTRGTRRDSMALLTVWRLCEGS